MSTMNSGHPESYTRRAGGVKGLKPENDNDRIARHRDCPSFLPFRFGLVPSLSP